MTTMFQFENSTFIELLKAAPEALDFFEQEEHSDYLQKAVFDPLKRGEAIGLQDLDFSAFSLRNVTTAENIRIWREDFAGWVSGFNRIIKKIAAEPEKEAMFF